MSYWQDKACLITGGSAGLGLALGQELARRGANVLLVARRKEPLDEAVAHIRAAGGRAAALPADVAWQDDVDRLAATVAADFGRLDFLCNCAGRSARAAVLDTTPDDFQQLLNINLLATVRTARAFAPQLIAARGHLVNVGSLASKVAAPFLGAYPASKHAVAAYTQQLRLELEPQGLHVLLVCPGPIARHESGVARPKSAPGVGETEAGPAAPGADFGRATRLGRYAPDAPNVPAAAHAPGGGARIKSIDPAKLAVSILAACERRQPELVVPASAKLLFALSQLSARWGDWLLRRSIKS